MSRSTSFHPTFPEQVLETAAPACGESRRSAVWTDARSPVGVLDPSGGGTSPGSRALRRVSGQRALLEAWWKQLDELTRRRLLRLAPENFLPADAALDLEMAGVRVIAVGTVAVDDGYDALYEQPSEVIDLLADVREGRFG